MRAIGIFLKTRYDVNFLEGLKDLFEEGLFGRYLFFVSDRKNTIINILTTFKQI